ncbi:MULTISPECIES: hypothetical protein [unclassified Leclercia]|uniref:Inner membrane protein n=1 Tax=Leclercia barmai TaxID=2785629 RepID=A0ABS7RZ79_9ENTR|nr:MULTISPECIES: hypothetical protein [unclassified Leclercia]MBZ0059624.1 hypothetical protein [Leclercia sp. EMC7]MCM5695223.1 hypothetical protein [Leclercia sp. LTM01]MCM5699632.1 hypothetical protein [Leclercia sp. LTM14]
MKPMHFVFLWIGEAFLFTLALITLYLFIPEMKAYDLIRLYTGVIPGDTWDKYYFLALCITALLTVSVIVYILALFKKRQH